MPQDTVLFNDTVYYNIAYGRPDAGPAEIEAAAKLASIHDFVMSLPDGYNTSVGERGLKLSGGEKQRVAIARSLANRPEILFLDEPFGALDAQTRSSMQAYLLKIWQNVDVTVFFVTHDLDEAIYLSDRILVLRANPGEIDELIEVPVPRPRAPGQFLTPEFLATKKRLEELIRPPELAQNDEFPMVRLTEVGDEVE